MQDHDCRETRLLLDAYHDGEVQPEERDLVDNHLQGCELCRSTLSEIQFVAESLSKLPTLAFKADFADRLEQKIVSAQTGLAQADCAEVEPLLDAFFDGEQTSDERQVVSAHLESCEKCMHALADIKRIAISLKALPALSMRLDVAQEFDSILARRKKVVPLKRPALWITAGIAAGFVLIAFAMHLTNSPQPVAVADAVPAIVAPHVVSKGASATAVDIAQVPTVAVAPRAFTGMSSGETNTKQNAVRSELNSTSAKGISSANPHHASNPSLDSSREIARYDAKAPTVGKGLSGSIERDTKIASTMAPPQSVSDRVISKLGADDVVAVYDAESNPAEELGISTDEDGLYAIKL